jgi:transposase
MFYSKENIQVFLAIGSTDMRKSINGLSVLVCEHINQDVFSGHLFGFCNRKRNIIKILYWDQNGFCLWHKRLEKDCFKWPDTKEEILNISKKELMWLINGMDIIHAHKPLKYSMIF